MESVKESVRMLVLEICSYNHTDIPGMSVYFGS